MKKKIIAILSILFYFQFGYCQASINSEHYKNVDHNNKLWNEEEVLQMAMKFEIQDSFFIGPGQLKEIFEVLCYMPQPDFDKYCLDFKSVWKHEHDWKTYRREIKDISTIIEWLDLLSSCPSVEKYYFDFSKRSYDLDFSEYVEKLENYEELIFVEEEGATVHIRNTRQEFNKHKHLKLLK